MEVFICQMPNAEKNYDEFMRLRKTAPASHRNPYKAVCDWFEKKYPYYGKSIVYNDEGKQVWNIVEASRLAKEEQARRAAANECNVIPMPSAADNAISA